MKQGVRHIRKGAGLITTALIAVFVISMPYAWAETEQEQKQKQEQKQEQPKKLPNPLTLEQAFSYAAEHPSLQATASPFAAPARPFYLDCHGLTYNNDSGLERGRNDRIAQLVSPESQQRLDILTAFFDVLLADLSFVRDNENMATVFIPWDRAKVRQELKQYSELQVAELEATYQQGRQRVAASSATQRLTRSVLAQALNHPQSLPSDLNPPAMPEPEQSLDLEPLIETATANNTWFAEQRRQADAANKALLDMALRQQILELILRLDVLKVVEQRAEQEINWRELRLEYSRVLYEQEVKADLGNSMVNQSRARLRKEQAAYCRTLTWAQLNALQGKPLLAPAEPNKDQD